MNKEEIKGLKNHISSTGNKIFSTFKTETISNLVICFEELEKENKQLKEKIEKLKDEKVMWLGKSLEKTNKTDEAIEYMEKKLIPEHPDWEYDEVIDSDLSLEIIKPLYELLKNTQNSH